MGQRVRQVACAHYAPALKQYTPALHRNTPELPSGKYGYPTPRFEINKKSACLFCVRFSSGAALARSY